MVGIEFNFQLNNKECIKSGYILNKKYINPINYDENIIMNYMLVCLDIYHKRNLLPNINKFDIKIHHIYNISEEYFYDGSFISGDPRRAYFKCGSAGLTEGCGSLQKTSSIGFLPDQKVSCNPLEKSLLTPSEKNYDFFLNLDERYFIFNNEKINIITSKL